MRDWGHRQGQSTLGSDKHSHCTSRWYPLANHANETQDDVRPHTLSLLCGSICYNICLTNECCSTESNEHEEASEETCAGLKVYPKAVRIIVSIRIVL